MASIAFHPLVGRNILRLPHGVAHHVGIVQVGTFGLQVHFHNFFAPIRSLSTTRL